DEPGWRRQLRAHGRRLGRGPAHHPAVQGHDHLPQARGDRAGGGEPGRRRLLLRSGRDLVPRLPCGPGGAGARRRARGRPRRAAAVNSGPARGVGRRAGLTIRPRRDPSPFRTRVATGQAVVNLIDDVYYFAQGAISSPVFPAVPAEKVRGVVLADACSWREVEVEEADVEAPRARFECRVVHRGFKREFLGFNRARHAVLEAAILATRTRLLPIEEILREYERLQVIVDKTAGPREHEAMAMLTGYVRKEAAALQGGGE